MGGFRPLLHLPKGLDLAPCVRAAGLEKWLPYAEWFVSAVVEGDAVLHKKGSGFVPLSDAWLRRGMAVDSIQPVRVVLLATGVLECDGEYSYDRTGQSDGDPLGYRLGPDYRGRPTITKEAIGKVPRKKLRKLHEWEKNKQQRHLEKLPEVHRRMYETLCGVTVLPGEVAEHAGLTDLRSGEPRYKRDGNGRVHHAVGNLPAELRRFIRFFGEEWAALDIKNSQPLLAGLAVRAFLRAHAGGNNRRTEENEAGKGRGDNPKSYCAAFSAGPDGRWAEPADLTAYIEACAAGRIYERVMADVKGHDGVSLSRDQVKQQFMFAMYDDPERIGRTDVGRALVRSFPTFAAGLAAAAASDERHFACKMQSLEADLTISMVADTLTGPGYGLRVLTVHDCVLIHPAHADVALRVIRDAWRAELGVTPTVGKPDLFTRPQEKRAAEEHERKRRKRKRVGEVWVRRKYDPFRAGPVPGRGCA